MMMNKHCLVMVARDFARVLSPIGVLLAVTALAYAGGSLPVVFH